jgi:hypothetical protein
VFSLHTSALANLTINVHLLHTLQCRALLPTTWADALLDVIGSNSLFIGKGDERSRRLKKKIEASSKIYKLNSVNNLAAIGGGTSTPALAAAAAATAGAGPGVASGG